MTKSGVGRTGVTWRSLVTGPIFYAVEDIMTCKILRSIAALAAFLVTMSMGVPVSAMGPVDGEVTMLYWASNTEIAPADEGSGAAGGRAEIWFFQKFGASAATYRPSPEGALAGTDLDYTNVDVKYRLLSPTQNNFVAVGAGWEKMNVSGVPDGDSSGARVVAEGRVGLVKILYLYGRAAYLPSLSDIDTGAGVLTDGTGREAELGLQIKPWPFVQFFVGYRSDVAKFQSPSGNTDFKNDGPFLGFGASF